MNLLAQVGPFATLVSSAACLAAAPVLLPESYSILANTTSESAAQGVTGAWLARLGFLLFGFGVLWVAFYARSNWPAAATYLHVSFGVLMVAAATFSTRSWESGVVFDPAESALHSYAATAMGFAFAFGVLVVLLWNRRGGSAGSGVHVIAIAAATLLPIGMSMWGAIDGALQRVLFTIAYIWYIREAVLAVKAELTWSCRRNPQLMRCK
jgi:hypothetical protein